MFNISPHFEDLDPISVNTKLLHTFTKMAVVDRALCCISSARIYQHIGAFLYTTSPCVCLYLIFPIGYAAGVGGSLFFL